MRKVRTFIIGTLLVGMIVLASCEKDENELYEFEAIDKEEVQEEGERD